MWSGFSKGKWSEWPRRPDPRHHWHHQPNQQKKGVDGRVADASQEKCELKFFQMVALNPLSWKWNFWHVPFSKQEGNFFVKISPDYVQFLKFSCTFSDFWSYIIFARLLCCITVPLFLKLVKILPQNVMVFRIFGKSREYIKFYR